MKEGPISVEEILPAEWLAKVEYLTIVLEELERMQGEFRKEGFEIEFDFRITKIISDGGNK